jgi:phosphoglycerol transferase MdoB-like AlkP superfamily enzyme
MPLFQAVRLFSAVESALFAALLVVWLGHVDDRATFILGLTHGVGFLCLCALIYYACLRRAIPWPVLASAVLLTPFGSTIHIEVIRRRRPAEARPEGDLGRRRGSQPASGA